MTAAAVAALFNLNFFRSIFVRRFIYHDLALPRTTQTPARPRLLRDRQHRLRVDHSPFPRSWCPLSTRKQVCQVSVHYGDLAACSSHHHPICPRSRLSFSQSASRQGRGSFDDTMNEGAQCSGTNQETRTRTKPLVSVTLQWPFA